MKKIPESHKTTLKHNLVCLKDSACLVAKSISTAQITVLLLSEGHKTSTVLEKCHLEGLEFFRTLVQELGKTKACNSYSLSWCGEYDKKKQRVQEKKIKYSKSPKSFRNPKQKRKQIIVNNKNITFFLFFFSIQKDLFLCLWSKKRQDPSFILLMAEFRSSCKRKPKCVGCFTCSSYTEMLPSSTLFLFSAAEKSQAFQSDRLFISATV